MMKKSEFVIIPELKLVLVSFAGTIGPGDLIAYLKCLVEDADFKPGYNIITDVRETFLEFSLKDMAVMVDFLKSFPQLTVPSNMAIMTETPNQAAAAHLLAIVFGEFPINMNYYTFLRDTLKWTGVPYGRFSSIENILDSMTEDLLQDSNQEEAMVLIA